MSSAQHELPVFCDWLKMKTKVQSVNRAAVSRFVSSHTEEALDLNRDEQCVHWTKPAWVRVKDARLPTDTRASDSTSIGIRYNSENHFILFDGNLGRFGHRENVWGAGVFGAGWSFLHHMYHAIDLRLEGSDIDLSRVDLTANMVFESASDAYSYLAYAGGIKLGRLNPRHYATGVQWVSDNWSGKIYDKLIDLKRHKHSQLADQIQTSMGYMLRAELTLRTDELQKYEMDTLAAWRNEDEKMNIIFTDKFKPFLSGGTSVEDLTSTMPMRLAGAFNCYRNGQSFPAAVADGRMNIRTYQRLRKDLLAYGIDISQPLNVTALNVKPREVPFSFVAAPEWYRKAAA